MAGIAAFAVEVAGGGYAGNEERRYLDVLFGQQGGTAALEPQAANRNCRIELFLK